MLRKYSGQGPGVGEEGLSWGHISFLSLLLPPHFIVYYGPSHSCRRHDVRFYHVDVEQICPFIFKNQEQVAVLHEQQKAEY